MHTIRTIGHKLSVKRKTNWVEVTIGVLGKKGQLKAFNPSLAISEGEVLTLEEKFQGGTGVNITPPSKEIVRDSVLKKSMGACERLVNEIGLNGYGRVDAFLNTKTGDLLILEVNTLPGLTPSTVLFHQALAENPLISPREFIEKIVDLGNK